MWAVRQILTGLTGLAAGMTVAAGLFSFICELGVVSDFADRTHTGKKVTLYEDCLALGGIAGNVLWVYQLSIPGGRFLLPVFGLFGGIFVGCWSMALAEVLNIFPVFSRRLKITRIIPWLIVGMALGKGLGALVFFFLGW